MKFLRYMNEIPDGDMMNLDEKTFVVYGSNGWICSDCTTACKSYKTALRRFFKALTENGESLISNWYAEILESCENGYFKMSDSGSYSWGIEEVSDGVWYVFLNINRAVHDESYAPATDEEELTATPRENSPVFLPCFKEANEPLDVPYNDTS